MNQTCVSFTPHQALLLLLDVAPESDWTPAGSLSAAQRPFGPAAGGLYNQRDDVWSLISV